MAEGGAPRRRRIHDWEQGRSSTWLELFFDLIFVVAVSRLGVQLHEDHSPTGVLVFTGLMATVWWAWISFSYFADLFDEDRPLDRIGQLLAMLGAALLAISLGEHIDEHSALYAATFAGLFVLLALLYWDAGRSEPAARELSRWYVAGSLIGAAGWALSIALPTPERYVLWGLAVAVNAIVSGPLAYARMRSAPHQVSHMPERFGLFVIVVLGETVFGVVNGIAETDWDVEAIVVAVAGFAIASTIWWLYFEAFEEGAIDDALSTGRGAQVRSFLYGYSHLVLYGAIAAFGVGVDLASAAAEESGELPLLLTGALCGVLVGFVVITLGLGRRIDPRLLVAQLALGLFGLAITLLGVEPVLGSILLAAGWIGLVPAVMHARRGGLSASAPLDGRSHDSV